MAPDQLTGIDVVGIEEAPDPVLTTGDANYGQVFDDQRRRGSAESPLLIDNLRVPENFPGLAVECQQPGIQSGH